MTRKEDSRRESRGAPRAAAPVGPGSLAWASAVGNSAVQRLARQVTDLGGPEIEEPAEAAAASGAEAEAPPPEVAALEQAGIGADAVAGLEAVDQLGEDAFPE